MKTYYKQVDYLRGIAMCLVLLCHSVIVYPINLLEDYKWYLLHEFTRYTCMPIFFTVSGFCFSYKGNYGEYIWKKIQRIMIPHLAFGLVDLIPRIVPNPFVNQQAIWREAVLDFLVTGGSDWFLPTLFNIFLVFPLIWRIYRKGGWAKVISWVLVGGVYVLRPYLPEELMIRMAALNLLYFMVGYEIKEQFSKREEFQKKIKEIPIMIAGFVIMVVMLVVMEKWKEPTIVESIGAIGGTVFFYGIACRIRGNLGKCLNEISKYSLQIFLMGGYALVLTRTLIVMVLGVQIPIVIILFNFIFDLLITWAISRYILARFKIFRFFSGL